MGDVVKVEYVTTRKMKYKGFVINMPLGRGMSQAFDDAVRKD